MYSSLMSSCPCPSAPSRADRGGCSTLLSSLPNGRYQDSSYVFCLGETYTGNDLYDVGPTP